MLAIAILRVRSISFCDPYYFVLVNITLSDQMTSARGWPFGELSNDCQPRTDALGHVAPLNLSSFRAADGVDLFSTPALNDL